MAWFKKVEEYPPLLHIPNHVAIIMDGNGRWAQKRGLQRVEGHKEGVEAVKRTVKAAAKFGVKYLTLYTFSTENWNRPKAEVDALMAMMAHAIVRETAELLDAGVRIKMIGNKMDLPEGVREQFIELEAKSANNSALTLLLAISYGARWEILQAAKAIAEDYKNGVIDGEESYNIIKDITSVTPTDITDTVNGVANTVVGKKYTLKLSVNGLIASIRVLGDVNYPLAVLPDPISRISTSSPSPFMMFHHS